MFHCGNSNDKGPHQHASAYEARVCYGLARPPVAPSAPVAAPQPPMRPASERQLAYIRVLGGHHLIESGMTMEEASAVIDSLVKGPKPAAPKPSVDPRLLVVGGLMDDLDSGNYAAASDGSKSLTFFHVTRPTRGKWAGTLKVQTRHSDALELALVRNVAGNWYEYRKGLLEDLLTVLSDPTGARMLFADELGMCSRCSKSLTDARSRHYGIGPECEKYWPSHIDAVDAVRGVYRP